MANPNDDLQKAKQLLQELNSLRRKLNREPLRLTDQEAINQLKSLPGDISNAKNALSDMFGTASDLYDRIKGITSEIKGQGNPITGIRKAFRDITADANKLKNDEQEIERLNTKQLSNLQKRLRKSREAVREKTEELLTGRDLTRLQADEVSLIKELADENGGINNLTQLQREQLLEIIKDTDHLSEEQKAILSNYYDQNSVFDELLDKTKERLKFETEIQDKIKGFSGLTDLIKAIPGLRKFAGPFEQAEKAAEEAARQGLDQIDINKKGLEVLKEGFIDLLKNPIAQLTTLASLFKSVLKIAFEVDKQITEIGKSQALSYNEAANFRKELFGATAFTGNLVENTKSLLESQTELSKQAGVTRGFKLKELKDQTMLTKRVGIQAESAAKLANLSRVSNQTSEQALDNVIKQTAGLKAQTGIQLDNRAVLEEVAETNGQIAANLSNNPSKIAAAVVQVRRLGLSLEQARNISESLLDFESSLGAELEAELLTGKQLNLERARGLALQGDFAGAAAEIASQVGSLADFQDMNVIAQRSLAKAAGMTVDELANSLQQQENLNKLGEQTKKDILERVEALKAEGKVEQANRLLSQAADEEAAKQALLRLDAQQKFNLAVEKLQNLFTGLANNMTLVLGILGAIAGVMAAIALSSVIATGGAALYSALGAMAVAGISGAVLGGGGGAILQKSLNTTPETKLASGGIVTKPTNALVGEAGAEAVIPLTKFYAKMDELISVVKKGGNVYIDGNRAGQAIAMSSYRLG